MNPDHHQLLAAVLEDAAPPDFRTAVWERTVQAVRWRRRARRVKQGLAATAFVVLMGLGLWHLQTSVPLPNRVVSHAPAPVVQVVRSQPLAPSILVTSQPGLVRVVRSTPASVTLITSGSPADLYRVIDDQKLLDLVTGRAAVLVRQGTRSATLVFAHPEDQAGWQVN